MDNRNYRNYHTITRGQIATNVMFSCGSRRKNFGIATLSGLIIYFSGYFSTGSDLALIIVSGIVFGTIFVINPLSLVGSNNKQNQNSNNTSETDILGLITQNEAHHQQIRNAENTNNGSTRMENV